MTSSLRIFETTFTIVIFTSMNNNGSTKDVVNFNQGVFDLTFSNTIGISGNVTQVTNVTDVISWTTVFFTFRVEVRTSRSTTIGVVTELMDVETSQGIWIVTRNFPGDSGWFGFRRLFEVNDTGDFRITSNDSN
ncbi:superoxide dismutase [Candida tropicalis MYA-3404]|uniref:Superoxide dismutase n=1 Tax=Candida tropicalis (strain ATCC MYA-3404 / T1) TaxID=294747 RepID=C5M270_CANTT|nr:superoxide dismutase [Candida tropicalis MYA-3404]EER35420.1 superoxide dismutase [Candida tropicalis MYA-3404]KAG4409524.1 hypothetical protein JTP64_000162 [Candida tropicalis]